MTSYIEVAVIATTIQAILFGLYFTTFLLCLRWLIFADEGWVMRKAIKWPMLTVTIIIFVFSVMDLSLSLEETLATSQSPDLIGIIIVSRSSFRIILVVMSSQTVIETLTAVITDTVLVRLVAFFAQTFLIRSCQIYRCWAVYNRSWPIAALPVVLLSFNFSSIIIFLYLGTVNLPVITQSHYMLISHVREAFYISTIVINIYATCTFRFETLW